MENPPIFKFGKPSISIRAIYTMAMLVITRLGSHPIKSHGKSHGKSHSTTIFLWFSYGFPMVFLWFSHGFPMVFLWFSYGFPMVFPWLSLVPSFPSQASQAPVSLGRSEPARSTRFRRPVRLCRPSGPSGLPEWRSTT